MICNKLTFNLISESSKGSEPAGAKISICWRLQDWELRMRCKIWADALAWQGKDGINPGHEGKHVWKHPACAHSLSLKSLQALSSRRGRFPPESWQEGKWSSHSAAQEFDPELHSFPICQGALRCDEAGNKHPRQGWALFSCREPQKSNFSPWPSLLCTCRTDGGCTVSTQRNQK